MKKTHNYSAWRIDTKEFNAANTDEEKLRFFSKYAILAPSGHNTQPWQFDFAKQSVRISVSKDRHLPHSGKVAAEPYVSIGACIETLVQAAKAYGHTLSVAAEFKPELRITIKLEGTTTGNPALAAAIIARRSNRELFEETNLPLKNLDALTKSSQPGVAVTVIEDKKDKRFLAEETAKATIAIMSEKEFRAELSNWVRNNLTKQYDGMPAFVQGMPTPPSLIAKHIIKNIDISKSQAKKDASRIIHSGALVLLSIDKSDSKNFIALGREYARICILAAENGLATSGVGAAVIDSASRQKIQNYFTLSTIPAALLRVGIPMKQAHHSPRLPLDMVTAVT